MGREMLCQIQEIKHFEKKKCFFLINDHNCKDTNLKIVTNIFYFMLLL